MKKILFKKILIDCLKFFLISLLSASIVVWVFQAVNFLDIMIEDGRGYLVYLNYTLLNFPKIISKILPFALFFSFFYVLTKYELNNELIIFWSFGINKIQLINFFIKFSFIIMIIQILFTSFFVPKSQELSRALMRDSNVDLLEDFIKPKKFNDLIKGLTIYAEEKNKDGLLKNIYLKKDTGENSFQVTYSKTGKFEIKGNNRVLKLYNGQTINGINNKISNFNFERSDFNLTNLDSDVVFLNKIQETSTFVLLSCLNKLFSLNPNFLVNIDFTNSEHNCSKNGLENIYKELYKRFIIPMYIPILILISLMAAMYSKENINYSKYRLMIFLLGLFIIIFSETTLKFIDKTFYGNIKMIVVPLFFFILLYLPIFHKFKFKFLGKRT
tara:strand:+ start:168 stop:1322 length:1155 start_codon:yes stop_codon:yes gene_type:complete